MFSSEIYDDFFFRFSHLNIGQKMLVLAFGLWIESDMMGVKGGGYILTLQARVV